MKKIIVTTTINEPTEALKKFKAMKDWELIVVGDIKTNDNSYIEQGYDYLTPEYQDIEYHELSDAIGWNCIQRRNIGMIEAYNRGADLIAVVDDDNIPLDNWGKNIYISDTEKTYKCISNNTLCIDPIKVTRIENAPTHRGFPYELHDSRNNYTMEYGISVNEENKFHIQANMWNGDPDIDAASRVSFTDKVTFPDFDPFWCKEFSPFNSQNTFLSREILKHYFLFPYVGRMDDIWASYYVEALGYRPLYAEATVYQERNDHDINIDIKNEQLATNNLKLLEALKNDPNSIEQFLPAKSMTAFKIYQEMFK
jgi:hypothetical protein